MYEKFTKDDEMWESAKRRSFALNLEISHKMEFYEKGFKIGLVEAGCAKGDLDRLIFCCDKAINKLFHVNCLTWLETLNKQQLEQVYDLVFEVNDFNLIKEKINIIK